MSKHNHLILLMYDAELIKVSHIYSYTISLF